MLAEHSLTKKFRKSIWHNFVSAVKRYELIRAGDKIAVCVSGGKDSFLLAKLTQMLCRYSDVPFETVFLAMDPGYREENLRLIRQNAERLEIPLNWFSSDIFAAAEAADKSPCYLCARMRRGHLYARARELGCNKIALGHHYSDVVETTLMGLLYGGQVQTMLPKLKSQNFDGMQLIRPLYLVREEDIIAWRDHCELEFIRCACRFTDSCAACGGDVPSARFDTKTLIRRLQKSIPNVEKNIFNAMNCVNLNTCLGYKKDGETHSFLEGF